MKILIASLQVSQSASKGHLHPAIELALEAKRRGHDVSILPLPSPLGAEDQHQLERANIKYAPPPSLPEGVLKTPGELAKFATIAGEVGKAYHSFLVAPLRHQFSEILKIMNVIKPDILIYDLLVYGAPLAARKLHIPDLGFCAGLKLVASEEFQTVYRDVREHLQHDLTGFLTSIGESPTFEHLELLSSFGQFVFATPDMIGPATKMPERTHLVGPLHNSEGRGDDFDERQILSDNDDFAILSFGSVLDPADFPNLTNFIIQATKDLNIKLIIGTQKLHIVPNHVTVAPYLPVPKLLKRARIFFHHGGANSFSEALLHGTPQILIPLTTDQPMQADFITRSGAGFSVHPNEVTIDLLKTLMIRLLNPVDPIHDTITTISQNYQASRGQTRVIEFAEQIVRDGYLDA